MHNGVVETAPSAARTRGTSGTGSGETRDELEPPEQAILARRTCLWGWRDRVSIRRARARTIDAESNFACGGTFHGRTPRTIILDKHPGGDMDSSRASNNTPHPFPQAIRAVRLVLRLLAKREPERMSEGARTHGVLERMAAGARTPGCQKHRCKVPEHTVARTRGNRS